MGKRTPQTFEKRARERDKQRKREIKKAERLARSLSKRDGTYVPEDVMGIENPERVADEEAQRAEERRIAEERAQARREAAEKAEKQKP